MKNASVLGVFVFSPDIIAKTREAAIIKILISIKKNKVDLHMTFVMNFIKRNIFFINLKPV